MSTPTPKRFVDFDAFFANTESGSIKIVNFESPIVNFESLPPRATSRYGMSLSCSRIHVVTL